MSKKAADAIMEGLEDAIAFAKGDKARGKAHVIEVETPDVRAVRTRLGMSQDKFARAFGVSPSTVRNWEQGRRQPEGPAKVLLKVIEQNPKAVLDAIRTK